MEISVLIYCAIALAVGCFVQSSIGFGMAIVAAPIIFLFEPRFVPGTITYMGLLLALTNTYQYRRSISYRGLGAAFAGRVPGTFVAGWLLIVMSSAQIAIVLGVGVLLAVVVSLSKVNIQPTTKSLFWAGFASGVMGTSTSIGGPPMALVLQHAEGSKLRANLSAYFLFSSALSLAVLTYTGHFSWWHMKYGTMMLPPSLFAIWFSFRIQHLIKAEWMRMAILVLCSVSGVTALYQGFTSL